MRPTNAAEAHRWLTVTCLAVVVLFAEPAASHVILTSHTTRHGSDSIKIGPCGRPQSERGGLIHIFEPGETIHLVWNEFISHPGYFRISFDEDGDDDFVDPASDTDFFTNSSVLVDELFAHQQPFDVNTYEFDLTLPNVECENCTIQLIQMMTDKPPYEVGTNDIYYNCLDVTLIREPSACLPVNDLAGDLDGDGNVGIHDFLELSANFGNNVDSYGKGDVTCDGTVGFDDFLALSANFGQSLAVARNESQLAAIVPEPCMATLGFIAFTSLALISRRRECCPTLPRSRKSTMDVVHPIA